MLKHTHTHTLQVTTRSHHFTIFPVASLHETHKCATFVPTIYRCENFAIGLNLFHGGTLPHGALRSASPSLGPPLARRGEAVTFKFVTCARLRFSSNPITTSIFYQPNTHGARFATAGQRGGERLCPSRITLSQGGVRELSFCKHSPRV